MGGRKVQPFFDVTRYLSGKAEKGLNPQTPLKVRRAIRASAKWGIDWFLWRPARSKVIGASIAEIREWSIADILEAHIVLDFEDAIRPDPPKQRHRRRS